MQQTVCAGASALCCAGLVCLFLFWRYCRRTVELQSRAACVAYCAVAETGASRASGWSRNKGRGNEDGEYGGAVEQSRVQ